MDPRERDKQIERLKQSNPQEQIEATRLLAQSGDSNAIDALLGVLEQPESHHSEVINSVIEELIAGTPATLAPILAYIEQSPGSRGEKDCAYILGEIAYKQGNERDPRILPTLLRVLRITMRKGTFAASSIVAALRECARTGSVADAGPDMNAVLLVAQGEEKPYLWTIDNALEVLYVIKGDQLLPELHTQIQNLPSDSGLAIALSEFLSAKGGV